MTKRQIPIEGPRSPFNDSEREYVKWLLGLPEYPDFQYYVDTLFSHLCGGIKVTDKERQSITYKEAHHGLRMVLVQMTCAHEWRVVGNWKFCDKCKGSHSI